MRSKVRIRWGGGKLKAAGSPHPTGHGIKASVKSTTGGLWQQRAAAGDLDSKKLLTSSGIVCEIYNRPRRQAEAGAAMNFIPPGCHLLERN